ncbi:hypothetical protein [Snodgrassella communis]|uniref:hypothetical protein n=1 Tax=Snodgrassella communis TaxID=2946699 RepID=UPI001EF51727|nr:hypothetical protein [Snodgrassella communis]
MGLLFKFYGHNGWIYYKCLGKTLPEPVVYLPFTAEKLITNTIWKNEINGRLLSPQPTEARAAFSRIHNNDDGVLLYNYKSEYPMSAEMPLSPGVELYGNSLAIRIKPGQFPDSPMILCVLYGSKDTDYEANTGEKLVIAIVNQQIVTYYIPAGVNPQFNKTETGIYLNGDDLWTSIGLNFQGENGYGLDSICRRNFPLLMKVNITPLKSLAYFCLFSSDFRYPNPEERLYAFNGGVAHAKVFRHPLNMFDFNNILNAQEYDDSIDGGVIYTDDEAGGLLMRMGINVVEPKNPPEINPSDPNQPIPSIPIDKGDEYDPTDAIGNGNQGVGKPGKKN